MGFDHAGAQKSDRGSKPPSNPATVRIGDRDYKTIQIGDQLWMAENLAITDGQNYCLEDNIAYSNKYGRLYDLASARRIAANVKGWHLPTLEDWLKLEVNLGMPIWVPSYLLDNCVGCGHGEGRGVATKLKVGGGSGLNLVAKGGYAQRGRNESSLKDPYSYYWSFGLGSACAWGFMEKRDEIYLQNMDGTNFYLYVRLVADSWREELPDCPCSYNDFQAMNHDTERGHWKDCGEPTYKYHPGKNLHEIRWLPNELFKAGQQCIFDQDGLLLQYTLAAGTPDMVSPGVCDPTVEELWGNPGAFLQFFGHYFSDVVPWGGNSEEIPTEYRNADETISSVPCWQYMLNWQPNHPLCSWRGKRIFKIFPFVGDMTCEEVAEILKALESVPKNLSLLRSVLLGMAQVNPSEVIAMLERWKMQFAQGGAQPNARLTQLIGRMIETTRANLMVPAKGSPKIMRPRAVGR